MQNIRMRIQNKHRRRKRSREAPNQKKNDTACATEAPSR